jgi:hypothetical protein
MAMLAGAAIVWHSRFSADMSFFLPAHPSAGQQVLVDQLREGAVTRLLMLGVSGGDAGQRAALSRELRARLASQPEFIAVRNGEAHGLDADREFLFRHRYLLSPAVTPERFSVAGLRAAIAESIDLLSSPAGLLVKRLLPQDPTGELIGLLLGLDAGAQPDSRAGVWSSRDGERAVLLAQTAALGSDTDAQARALDVVREAFAAARTAAGGAGRQPADCRPGRICRACPGDDPGGSRQAVADQHAGHRRPAVFRLPLVRTDEPQPVAGGQRRAGRHGRRQPRLWHGFRDHRRFRFGAHRRGPSITRSTISSRANVATPRPGAPASGRRSVSAS